MGYISDEEERDVLLQKNKFYSLRRIYSAFLAYLWCFILLVVIIYRLAVMNDSTNFFTHYTNWSWLFMSIFYTIDCTGRIFFFFDPLLGNKIRKFNCFYLFWMVNASIWLVIVIVTIIIQENYVLIIEAADDGGGSIGAYGFVTSMHILFHYVPGYFIIAYMVLEYEIIVASLRMIFSNTKRKVTQNIVAIEYWLVFMTLFIVVLPFGTYSIIFDPKDIYGFHLNIGIVTIIAIITIFFTNVIPFYIYLETFIWPEYISSNNKNSNELEKGTPVAIRKTTNYKLLNDNTK